MKASSEISFWKRQEGKTMANNWKKKISLLLAAFITAGCIAGCGSSASAGNDKDSLSYDEAIEELDTLEKKVDVTEVKEPALDIYSDDTSEKDSLADISTFPVTVQGSGDINIEVAAATEISGEVPDDWITEAAKEFNDEGHTVNGKSVSVTVRRITSGEVFTYVTADVYKPQVFIPSNYAWGMMLDASGITTTKITDRIAGNTAGILMKKDVYDSFVKKYKNATVANILKAANAGDITFAYTNPYTSSAGLNVLTAMLYAFDPDDPLSSRASEALMEYQKTSPPVAYTTAVLRNQAKKGIVNAMVMEEQAYINTPELKGYEYIPVGIRHDHPVYTFSWTTDEQKQAAEEFVKFCQSDSMQALAAEKGFNRHDDYTSQDTGLSGTGYLSAQQIWKENKSGGNPIVAVFVADVSGSMNGTPLKSLQESLISTSKYIGSENYIGLVSYSSDVTINLSIDQFDAKQRAYFSGEVKELTAGGGTATYNAMLVAMKMIEDKLKDVPGAKPMLFVLTDGEQNVGYSLRRVIGIVGGLDIPVYTIAYNYTDSGIKDLETLSNINEAATIKADSDDIVNNLRNLFNTQL